MAGRIGTRRAILTGAAPAFELGPQPSFANGAKVATLGDSLFARGHQATTSGARTTAQNRACSMLTWAFGLSPRFKHTVFWDNTATAANDIPTYGAASAGDNLFRGANFGYFGDTALGVTRRTAQVISSGATICYLNIGTNTDSPNTSAQKIIYINQVLTALRAGGVHVLLGTIRPRWSGERTTLNNAASVTAGSAVVTITHTAHGMTNTSATTKQMEFVSPGLTIDNITLLGVITSGSGGYTVNVVDANTFTITTPTLAANTVSNGGGSFTYHRNVFLDPSGAVNLGNCLMPSDPRNQTHRDVNDWIISQEGRAGVTICDLTAALRDATRSAITGVYLDATAAYVIDGVHASPQGAYAEGLVVQGKLDSIIQAGSNRGGAWFNPDPTVSNLVTNGTYTGTGGTVGAGCTGTIATNASISNVNGAGQPVTCVSSVSANSDTGGQLINLVISSTGAGSANTFNTIRLTHTNPSTGFTSTDWVSVFWEIEISGNSAGVLRNWQVTLGQASTISNRGLGQTNAAYNTEPHPTDSIRMWIQSEPLLIEARTSLNPRLDLACRQDVNGSFTLKARCLIMRIVTAPSTDFPWVP